VNAFAPIATATDLSPLRRFVTDFAGSLLQGDREAAL
jgi:hypothetical protein